MQFVGKVLTKIFGSRNERLIKRYRKIVAQINELEPRISELSDVQLKERTQEIREQIIHKKITINDVLPEALAIIRESMDRNIGIRNIFNPDYNFDPETLKNDKAFNAFADAEDFIINRGVSWQTIAIPEVVYKGVREIYPDSRPPFRARCFDVQLIGGLALFEGKIAEMATGEGKTFVAPLACFLRALGGYHCHVVTVNDYLVKRDATWVRPAFEALGISVGFIQAEMDAGGESRRKMYECDITYGTNSEFGFDYLRDNMKPSLAEQVQGSLDYAIVDEVDSILIDEARTPLIISGAAKDDPKKYATADSVARKIMELHLPYGEIEKEVDHWKRMIKAALGDADKAPNKEEKEAARKRGEEAQKQLEAAESKKIGLIQYYEVEMDRKSVHLTHDGIAAAQEEAGVGSFYVGENMEWPHMMEQAMRAHVVYQRDRDYVVERGQRSGQPEVVIVDEYTGRKMVGRQWSEGLHQAVEAKERVQIKEETQTLATITLQNFFKLYKHLAGMTGTAMTESEEFNKIYQLEVVNIPTNRGIARRDYDDRVYRTEQEKWEAIVEEIKLYSDAGRPVLVGTTSVEKSEVLSRFLTKKYGVKHEVLNAKQHEREANIVQVAGQTHVNNFGNQVGNVTIATNMAGRGTDIKLSAEVQFDVAFNAESKSWTLTQRATGRKIEVKEDEPQQMLYGLTPSTKTVGGLHVMGTERHTSRRIDNQLRGRSGRQGDPGSSRFYCSLQDDLLAMFMGEFTINIMKRIGMQYGEAIESGMLTKGILRAQKKVEERNYLARKNLLEYDEVNDHQRNIFYGIRQQVLEGRQIENVVWKMIGDAIKDAVQKYVVKDFVAANISEWARTNFKVNIDADELKGLRRFIDVEEYIKNQAKLEIETTLLQTLGEYLGETPDDPSNWDVKSIEKLARDEYNTKLSASQIRKMTSAQLEGSLKTGALDNIDSRDCAGIMQYLEPDFSANALCSWALEKFGVIIKPDEILADAARQMFKPQQQIVELIDARAREIYKRREVEYPIDYMLSVVAGSPEAPVVTDAYAADYLRTWTRYKYNVDLPLERIQITPLRQIRDELIGFQEKYLIEGQDEKEADLICATGDLNKITETYNERFGQRLSPRDLDPLTAESRKGNREVDSSAINTVTTRDIVLRRLRAVLRDELTRLEQYVLINIFDQNWKDHLYAMDILKSGIGLQSFAEKDPRIIYKREGYLFFESMMQNIRDQVTDIIFRVYAQGREVQTRSAYKVTAAKHEVSDNYGVGDNVRETQSAIADGSVNEPESVQPTATTVKTIVRESPKLGRNDMCPNGTGKKYKQCCGANREDGVCDGKGK